MIWMIILVMTLCALTIVLLPLLQTVHVDTENRRSQNVEIAKEQLNKLKQDRQQGVITEADYELAVVDLEKSLHSDLSTSIRGKIANYNIGLAYKTSGTLLLLLPVMVGTLYYFLGSPMMIGVKTSSAEEIPQQVSPSAAQEDKVSDVRSLFESLKKRLEANPDDAQGWMMMGLSYMHFEEFDNALNAYEKAVALMPNNPDAQAGLERAKQALSSGADKPVTNNKIDKKMTAPNGQVVDVGSMVMRLQKKLEANPNNLEGWMMLGRSYTNLGLANDAVVAYENALKLQPGNDQILALLDEAKQAVAMKAEIDVTD
jgi:cytochrome c-type biogenesis protein CcmH